MKYYVRTVEDCTPKLYSFKTKKAMETFKTVFLKKANKRDTWIDLIFKGDIILKEEFYE